MYNLYFSSYYLFTIFSADSRKVELFSGKILPCDFSPRAFFECAFTSRQPVCSFHAHLSLACLKHKIHFKEIMQDGSYSFTSYWSKGQPTYRIVAAERKPLVMVAFWKFLVFTTRAPSRQQSMKEDRVFHWMKNGALPTELVAQVFSALAALAPL